MSPHISLDELADASASLFDRGRAAVIEEHLAECGSCRRTAASLGSVSTRLAAEPAPVMPAGVMARLEAAVRQESSYRSAGVTTLVRPIPRIKPSLGTFGADLPRRSRKSWIAPALAAAVTAAAVGFGGYVVSASAGLNEPPSVVSTVNSGDLGPEARALQQSRDLGPHRFSKAWRCARKVTDGRIVGIASTTVDGGPALLVYTRSDGVKLVTVVTGCRGGSPIGGASVPLGG